MASNDQDAIPAREPACAVTDVTNAVSGAVVLAGLALRFDEGSFRIDIIDDEQASFLSLGPYSEEEVVAIWRGLARSSGLPLLAETADGSMSPMEPQIGRIVLGRRLDRRNLKVLSGRRPRFLVKRKPGRLPRRPAIHREPELASGRRPR